MNKIYALVAFISLLWIAVGVYVDRPENIKAIKNGALAPEFTLHTLSGKTLSLSNASGKPLVINFWNSWCPPCQEETPVLAEIYRAHKGEFQLYGINVTTNDTINAVKLFMENFHISYPILLDKSGKVSHKYDIRGMPTTILINRKGQIAGVIVGFQGKKELRNKILTFISKS